MPDYAVDIAEIIAFISSRGSVIINFAPASKADFMYILGNNLKVMIAFVLFSVIYGAGTVIFLIC